MISPEEQLLYQLRKAREQSELQDGGATTDIILSVKQQEAKYEHLSRQIERERQDLADQLEQVQLGSETASLRSISESAGSSFNGDFQYRPHIKVDDYSDTESRASTAQPPINSAHTLNNYNFSYNSNNNNNPNVKRSNAYFNEEYGYHSLRDEEEQPPNVVEQTSHNTQLHTTPSGGAFVTSSSTTTTVVNQTSNNTNRTPLSARRASNKGPQYNFTPTPTSTNNPSFDFNPSSQNQNHPQEEFVEMRSSRQNLLNSSRDSPDGVRMQMQSRGPPERPQLPVEYSTEYSSTEYYSTRGNFNEMKEQDMRNRNGGRNDGFMNDEFDEDDLQYIEPTPNEYIYPAYPPGQISSGAPNLMNPNGSLGSNRSRDLHPNDRNMNPPHTVSATPPPPRPSHLPQSYFVSNALYSQYDHNGDPQDVQSLTPSARSRPRDGVFDPDAAGTPRSHKSNGQNIPFDPRSPGVPRTPATTLDQFGNPIDVDSNSVSGGSDFRYNQNPSHNTNPSHLALTPTGGAAPALYSNGPTPITPNSQRRQPLTTSQQTLNSSSGRLPLPASRQTTQSSTSNMMQTYSHHPPPPQTIMIDAASSQTVGNNFRFSPNSEQPSPGSHAAPRNIQVAHGPVTPVAFEVPDNTTGRDQRWRNPNLPEILQYLEDEDPRIVLNAAAYLQHLTYEDQAIKVKVRERGGIPIVYELIKTAPMDLKKNLLGILRNMSYGRGIIENKLRIADIGCVQLLAEILRTHNDPEIQELACAVLWNLSSEPDIKQRILDFAMPVLVEKVILPESRWLEYESKHDTYIVSETLQPANRQNPSSPLSNVSMPEWSLLFRNATGCIRNLSAEKEEFRRRLRETRYLIDALIHVLNLAIIKNEVSGRAVENCICIIRNLTFHLYVEMERGDDPRLNSFTKSSSHNKSKSGNSKSTKSSRNNSKNRSGGDQKDRDIIPENDPHARGTELFWQPMMANLCIVLLRESSNPDTLEAAAGTLQNMCAGDYWWCPDMRFVIRKRMGLPVLRELLATFENDFVIAAVAAALRNICHDHTNRNLIGQHSTAELIKHLPPSDSEKEYETVYWDKVANVLLCLTALCEKHEENCRYVRQCDGLYRIIPLAKYRLEHTNKVLPSFKSGTNTTGSHRNINNAHSVNTPTMKIPMRVVIIAEKLLVKMWNVKEMRKEYKEHGFVKAHFDPKAIVGIKKKYEPRTLTRRDKTKSADDLHSGYGSRSRHGTEKRGGAGTLSSERGGTGGSNNNTRANEYSTQNRPPSNPPSSNMYGAHQVQGHGEFGGHDVEYIGGGGATGTGGYVEYNNINGQPYHGDASFNNTPADYRTQDMLDSPSGGRGLDRYQLQHMPPQNNQNVDKGYNNSNGPENYPLNYDHHQQNQIQDNDPQTWDV